MDFRISDTFTDSLARLTGEEQKTVPRIALGLRQDCTKLRSRGLSTANM
jgi:hypothetical protein